MKKRLNGGQREHRGGFSLAEMLMVVAVLSVLLAVLVPSFGEVKRRAQTTACMNNLRQSGLAIMAYAADYGHFPYSSQFDYEADWGESLLPYMVSPGTMDPLTEVWASPGMSKLTDGSWTPVNRNYSQNKYNYFTCPLGKPAVQGYPRSVKYAHNYACNEFLMAHNYRKRFVEVNGTPGIQYGGDFVPPSAKPQDLDRPGSLILICDTGIQPLVKDYNVPSDGIADSLGDAPDTIGGAIGTIVADFYYNPDSASTRGEWALTTSVDYEPIEGVDSDNYGPSEGWPVYARHNGFCNALMADGHIQQYRNGEMKRRNFVSKAKAAMLGAGVDPDVIAYVDIFYP